MSQIKYDIFREASGNAPLDQNKTQIGFKTLEDGDVVETYSFSVHELEEHIKNLEKEGKDSAIFREALHEARGKDD